MWTRALFRNNVFVMYGDVIAQTFVRAPHFRANLETEGVFSGEFSVDK